MCPESLNFHNVDMGEKSLTYLETSFTTPRSSVLARE